MDRCEPFENGRWGRTKERAWRKHTCSHARYCLSIWQAPMDGSKLANAPCKVAARKRCCTWSDAPQLQGLTLRSSCGASQPGMVASNPHSGKVPSLG